MIIKKKKLLMPANNVVQHTFDDPFEITTTNILEA